jgi:hypothetical protein
MDIKNPLHTAATFRLVRAEQVAFMLLCGGLLAWQWEQVNWWRAIAAFWGIDMIGYIPGALAYRRRGGGPIRPLYHHLYNIAHTYLVVWGGIALWCAVSGPEWAMLAGPFHLSIDRGVFGNVFKPVELPFEPVPVPEIWPELMGASARQEYQS